MMSYWERHQGVQLRAGGDKNTRKGDECIREGGIVAETLLTAQLQKLREERIITEV